MLPPGIFLWESGFEEMVTPACPESLSVFHASWAHDIGSFGPWSDSININGLGRFLKSPKVCETTTVVTGLSVTTMTVARMLAEQGVLGEWGSVVSVEQSQGRGQLRRPWVSSPGNLHVSMILPAAPTNGAWAESLRYLLPLVVGYIYSKTLSELGANIRIKWPNDLLQGDKKIGGMLIEEKNGLVILGLGINLAESPSDEQMREDCSVSAGVLQISDHDMGALGLWEILVNRGKSMYEILLDEFDPPSFISEVANKLAWFGRTVQVREGESISYNAIIIGISPEGGLVISRDGKEDVLISGSILPL